MAREKHWADNWGNQDSDRDGLSDEFETNVVGTDPHKRDTDGDGLNDYREKDFGTNPVARDSDGDGLSDGREVTVGTNPWTKDSDQDNVSDYEEVRRNTAQAPDTDGDGTPDWVELARDPHLDSDGDGLTDGEEHWLRTKPFQEHSDRDMEGDFWEVAVGEDPRTPDGPGPRVPSVPDGPYKDGEPEPKVPDGPYRDPADGPFVPGGPDAMLEDDGTSGSWAGMAATPSTPVVTSVEPASLAAGQPATLVLTGYNLSGVSHVWMCNAYHQPTVWSDTELRVEIDSPQAGQWTLCALTAGGDRSADVAITVD